MRLPHRLSLAAALAAALALSPVSAIGEDTGFSTWTPGEGGTSGPPRRGGGLENVTVAPGTDIATITEALKRVRPGGVITVMPGVYREDVRVGKAVTIRGQSRGSARAEIQPSEAGACLYVEPDLIGAVSVSGMSFKVTALYGSVPCIVVDGGVFTLRDSHVTARDNIPGVLLRAGLAHVENSLIEGGRFGVLVEARSAGAGDFYVIDNELTGNMTGLRVQGPGRVNAFGNKIVSNASDGIVLFRGGGTFIANEIAENGANGVVLNEGVLSPRFVSNRIASNTLAGIYVPLGAQGEIVRNEISGNGHKAFRCEQSPCPTFADNMVSGNLDDPEDDRGRRRGGLFD